MDINFFYCIFSLKISLKICSRNPFIEIRFRFLLGIKNVFRIQHKMYTTPRASPTLATSDTYAREPRQSALSTCLPLRPSNYQSEGLRCPAARSVLQFNAWRQRESSSLLHACNGRTFTFNKFTILLHTEVLNYWTCSPRSIHFASNFFNNFNF